MITILRAFLYFLITAAAIYFALTNRETVSVSWSPVHDPLSLPVFLLGLGGFGIGFILGGVIVWLNNLSILYDRRRQKKRVAKLEKELEEKEKREEEKAAFQEPLKTGEYAPLITEQEHL